MDTQLENTKLGFRLLWFIVLAGTGKEAGGRNKVVSAPALSLIPKGFRYCF